MGRVYPRRAEPGTTVLTSRPMTPSRPPNLEIQEALVAGIQALPHPSRYFRAAIHRFLSFLRKDFPQLRQVADLRRDLHLLGCLRCLSQEDPPLSDEYRCVAC